MHLYIEKLLNNKMLSLLIHVDFNVAHCRKFIIRVSMCRTVISPHMRIPYSVIDRAVTAYRVAVKVRSKLTCRPSTFYEFMTALTLLLFDIEGQGYFRVRYL